MTGLRDLYRHWQIGHDEARRRREQQRQFELRTLLGAHGFPMYQEPFRGK